MSTATSKRSIPTEEVDSRVYSFRPSQKFFKLTGLGILLFVIGFAFNFPLQETVSNQVKSALLAQNKCPISFKKVRVGLFPPRVGLIDATFASQCFPRSGTPLKASQLSAGLYWPGISPFGLRFFLPFQSKKTKLEIYPTLTFSGVHLNIKNSRIDSQLINKFLPPDISLRGTLVANSLITIPYTGKRIPSDGKFHIKSTNLSVPPSDIRGFELPHLPLTNLSLKGEFQGENLKVVEFILGDERSPIKALFEGNILMQAQSFMRSNLDLNGTLSFTEDFLKEFSFIKLVFKGNPNDQGQYKVRLEGPLAKPNLKTVKE